MAQLGADVDALDAVATAIARDAERLQRARHEIDAHVTTAWWRGGDAEGFRARWRSTDGAQLARIAGRLGDVAVELRRQAADQRRASGDAPLGGGMDGLRAPATDPERAEQLQTFATRAAEQRRSIDGRLAEVRRRLADLRAEPDHGGLAEWFGDVLPGVNSRDESIAAEIGELETLESQLRGLLGESAATGEPRQFLRFDAAPGDHRLVEVVGDLRTADRVVIHVPGMNTDLGEYAGGGHGNATNLFRELDRVSGDDVVVISFMDYNVPDDVLEAAGDGGADSGVEPLRTLVGDLHRLGLGNEDLAVVAHSYGSVVTGHTMQEGLDVGTVVTVGSPGMSGGANDRLELGSPHAALWSAAADDDAVAWAPFHGEDPSADGFGANQFDIGDVSGHSEYFDAESRALTNLARIAAGLPPL